jgi:hypothetical protein
MTLPAPHVLGLNLDPQTRCDHNHGPTDIIAIKTKCCGEFYELDEEWSCSVRSDRSEFLGMFTAPAANESGCLVEAALYRVELVGTINAASEIEEVIWLDPNPPHQIHLAPLTKDIVLPLAALL